MALSFKGVHFPRDIILQAVFFPLRSGASYCDLEEIRAGRGVGVDHATLNRWVERCAGRAAEDARHRRQPTGRSWRKDRTRIRAKGQRVHLHRTVDEFGKTLDFRPSKRRNRPAVIEFLAWAMEVDGLPRGIIIDKSATSTHTIKDISRMPKHFGCPVPVEMVGIKYLNDLVEQDSRFIKRRVRPMPGFQSCTSAASTIAGVEIVNMIRKGPFRPGLRPFQRFCRLAA